MRGAVILMPLLLLAGCKDEPAIAESEEAAATASGDLPRADNPTNPPPSSGE
jgi:hypothetical protein